MKKSILILMAVAFIVSSCGERVPPNYYGVLMENYGKSGKSDYTRQQGRVNTMSPGTELFVVPTFIQRGTFEKTLHLKSSDNTELTAKPLYSYKVNEQDVIDVVFENARLGNSENFLKSIEDNVIEPQIYDLIKEESRKYVTDTLMSDGGSLKFEKRVETIVKDAFEKNGLVLLSFTTNLDFSTKVKNKIESRNEVNTNVSVLEQQIIEQRKRNELAELKAQENLILSKGITPQLLQQEFIDKWDGKTPLYGSPPLFLKNVK